MPTPQKESQVEDIKSRLSRCTIAIATGYQGMSASNMTDLRARLRELGIEYRVIKNTLALRAAAELGKDGVERVLQGPTAIAYGYGDATEAAKGLNGYITTSRLPLVIHGAVMDAQILTSEQVVNLAMLPPRDEILSRLLGQMQAPISGLVTVLSAPLRSLVTVLQRASEQGGGAPAAAAAEEQPAAESADAPASEADAAAEDATAAEPVAEAVDTTDEESSEETADAPEPDEASESEEPA
ncbi:MAG: 50S ribosomal protein L10 [Chloroflexota bacterium]|nr:50S ribosomal protein L10 [Chloroflexota bacterium]MDE2941472.1 50S ribosomal protein L10 [Chloroflexota bacterium]MDE3268104.1 50S ribosomal protein L10 [Chloroflexota bacterium]